MDFDQIAKDFHTVWENQPLAIVLLIAGFVIFVFLVIDTWVHKRRRKRPRVH